MMQEIKHAFPVIGGIAVLVLTIGISACTKAKTNTEQATSQKVSRMNIRFDIEGSAQPVFVRLKDSPTTQDFIKQLPLTLELTDYAATEKIAYLPKKLTSQRAPKGHPAKAGDITYYAPWGNLAVFYKDFDGVANSLIYLGKFDTLPKAFSSDRPVKVKISNISK
ncbi:cyclophilin-like fold protein [Acinetobacter sp. A-IN1]|uniref:Cyclophilin-like fold protein n=2 Tax=Acinetobacter nematophilus TaxID=2994642 RepID=A0A9X3IGH4_9GAMM|nr:cyclophilin-like fold protein [Acinetobacter nematophilus]MCX5467918.1 cyclophilin-like fold protein [Acinetobacter nematophilus]